MYKFLFFANLVLGIANMINGHHVVGFFNFVATGIMFDGAFPSKP